MRKFFLLWLPVLLFLTQVIFANSQIAELVTARLDITTAQWQTGLGIILVLGFLANHFFTVFRPFKRFERFEATKLELLDGQTESLINEYWEKRKIKLRINVMLRKRKVFSRIEPKEDGTGKGKPHFLQECLVPQWVSSTMKHHGDANMVLTTNQGVAGKAFRRREPIAVDVTVDDTDYFLNEDQVRKSNGVKFILSFPIRSIDPETYRTNQEVIGVVNVDSRSKESKHLVQNPDELTELVDKVQDVSELCSQLF